MFIFVISGLNEIYHSHLSIRNRVFKYSRSVQQGISLSLRIIAPSKKHLLIVRHFYFLPKEQFKRVKPSKKM